MSSDFDNMNTWNINFYYIIFKIFSLSIHVASGDKHSYTQIIEQPSVANLLLRFKLVFK